MYGLVVVKKSSLVNSGYQVGRFLSRDVVASVLVGVVVAVMRTVIGVEALTATKFKLLQEP